MRRKSVSYSLASKKSLNTVRERLFPWLPLSSHSSCKQEAVYIFWHTHCKTVLHCWSHGHWSWWLVTCSLVTQSLVMMAGHMTGDETAGLMTVGSEAWSWLLVTWSLVTWRLVTWSLITDGRQGPADGAAVSTGCDKGQVVWMPATLNDLVLVFPDHHTGEWPQQVSCGKAKGK